MFLNCSELYINLTMLTQLTNQYKFDDPERVAASNMINILDRDDEVFGIQSTLPDFVYTVEKSQYQAISEEMLKEDKDYFLTKMEWTEEDLNEYIKRPEKKHNSYKSEKFIFDYLLKIYKILKF